MCDVEVGPEAIRPQNRWNPSVPVRKAPRAFVGQDGILRRTGSPPSGTCSTAGIGPSTGAPWARPQVDNLPHTTPANPLLRTPSFLGSAGPQPRNRLAQAGRWGWLSGAFLLRDMVENAHSRKPYIRGDGKKPRHRPPGALPACFFAAVSFAARQKPAPPAASRFARLLPRGGVLPGAANTPATGRQPLWPSKCLIACEVIES